MESRFAGPGLAGLAAKERALRIAVELQREAPDALRAAFHGFGERVDARQRFVAHRTRRGLRLAREVADLADQLVKDARELVGQVRKLSGEASGAAGAVRDDTLPRVNALAETVERSAQRVGRLAQQLDREPQSAIFGRKPGRPGPGEPGFQ